MKRLYTIIFAIILLTGWVGCQTADTEKSVTQTELIAMQGNYRVASYSDASSLYLWLQDKDGNVKEVSVKKEDVSSVKEEHGQVVIVFKDGSRATFPLDAYINVTFSENKVSLAKSDSVVVTFTVKADSYENVGAKAYESDNVKVIVNFNEGKDGGTLLFIGKGIASFKEDVTLQFYKNGAFVDVAIPTSRLRFGFSDGQDSKTYLAVGDGEYVEWSLLGGIRYEVENDCDWIEIADAQEDCLKVRFLENGGEKRTSEFRMRSEEGEVITISVVQSISQRSILMKLYEATNGDNWKENENWCVSDNIKDWYGVVMNDKGHVTGLYLSGNHLEGTLPDELFELVSLEDLILDSPKHSNTLDGEDKDNWNLIYGDLNELGPKIAQLTNLKRLDFNGLVNITCKDIPDEIWMPQMERIVLSQLSIKGRITPAIGNATNLKYLDISRNNRKTDLRGTIPAEITKLKHLEELDLSYNSHLTGPIPKNIGDMTSLKWLRLDMCALMGTIPESIFKLKNLRMFDVACNFLEGDFDLGRLVEFPDMCYFCIEFNNYMQGTGEIPDFIETLSFDRNDICYCYQYGKINWTKESYYHTSEMLAERLAEE